VSGHLVIKIADTGCGMNDEQQQRLFQKFSQVSADPQMRNNGVGLGLWITKSLIRTMGGEVCLYSKEHEGSSFDLKIPAEADENYAKRSYKMDSETSLINSGETRASHSQIRSIPISVAVLDCSAQERLKTKQLVQETGASLIEEFDHENRLALYLSDYGMDKVKPFDVVVISVEQWSLNEMVACWKRLLETYSTIGCDCKFILVFGQDMTQHDRERFNLPFDSNHSIRIITRTAENTDLQKALSDVIKFSKKILIADDDCYNLGIMENFINKLGYECLKASNGKEAIEIYQKHSKEIKTIIFDNEMPELTGLEAGKQINRLVCSDNSNYITMYLLTGSLDTELRRRAREVGFKEAISKPFEFENLANLLK